ncbi:MAG: ATPase [Planctomycetota bacterium]
MCLESDIDPELEIPGDADLTADLLRSLAQQALDAMPDGGDLMVTACMIGTTLELEIADNGGTVHSRRQTFPIAAAALKVDLHWQDCPQGGGSVTMTFPPVAENHRAAA